MRTPRTEEHLDFRVLVDIGLNVSSTFKNPQNWDHPDFRDSVDIGLNVSSTDSTAPPTLVTVCGLSEPDILYGITQSFSEKEKPPFISQTLDTAAARVTSSLYPRLPPGATSNAVRV
ncbi:hypothetical protein RRG08_053562 [Elysia crispata]|nr:hypothetical protein RRG08_053562 [Elysia crispata]